MRGDSGDLGQYSNISCRVASRGLGPCSFAGSKEEEKDDCSTEQLVTARTLART